MHLLMDFLGDTNTASAFDVAMFVREIAQTNDKLRESILQRQGGQLVHSSTLHA